MSRFLTDIAQYISGFVAFMSYFNYSYWVYPILFFIATGIFFFLVTDNK